MEIGNIFKAFQPKDTVFFTLFEKVATNLVYGTGQKLHHTI